MKDWKTTLAGMAAAVLNAFATGAIHGDNWLGLASSLGIAALGYLAADKGKN